MLYGLGAHFFEAARQALAQDPRARRRRVEPGDEDEVRSMLIEAKRLRDMVAGQHHPGVRCVCVDAVHQPHVAGAAEYVVGDARNDELRVLDAGMAQRVRVGDVPVDAFDVLAAELSQHGRIEVDDQDLLDEAP